jgi:hypothetical protein
MHLGFYFPAKSLLLRWHLRYVYLRLLSSLRTDPAPNLRRRSLPPALKIN